MSSWVEYHFSNLRRWREYAEAIARAVHELVPRARVYVVGSVARGRYTVMSDIDILVVLPRDAGVSDRRRFAKKLLIAAMDRFGLPIDAPIEIHVVFEGEEDTYLREGYVEIDADRGS